MHIWLFAGLGLYLAQVFLPTMLYMPAEGLMTHLGSRDELPEPGRYVGRARRALKNMQENLPLFLGLGVLALVLDEANLELAGQGAMVFVLFRALYVPAYLVSIPMTRSLAYGGSLVGLGMMFFALI